MESKCTVGANGVQHWRIGNKLHRADGPATIWPDGVHVWCWQGWATSFNEWLALNSDISEEEKVMLKLEYG